MAIQKKSVRIACIRIISVQLRQLVHDLLIRNLSLEKLNLP